MPLKLITAFISGKVAWSKKIEDEQLGGQIEAERGSRQAAQAQTPQGYLPTFFTSQDNLSQLEATRRAARYTESPIDFPYKPTRSAKSQLDLVHFSKNPVLC